MKVKICGIKDKNIAKSCIDFGADYIGLVFFEKSPRNICIDDAIKLADYIRKNAEETAPQIVALTVNASDELIHEIGNKLYPDFIQCHGNEPIERLEYIQNQTNTKLIKAFKILDKSDVIHAFEFYQSFPHFLPLFDAKPPKDAILPGGNGQSFDWTLLSNWPKNINFMLSGGLTIHNVNQAILDTGAKILDISSGVESSKGVKSAEMIKQFIDHVEKRN